MKAEDASGRLDFESWLVARERALQRTALLLAGDPHSAQDLVQTTLAKLYLSWDRVTATSTSTRTSAGCWSTRPAPPGDGRGAAARWSPTTSRTPTSQLP